MKIAVASLVVALASLFLALAPQIDNEKRTISVPSLIVTVLGGIKR